MLAAGFAAVDAPELACAPVEALLMCDGRSAGPMGVGEGGLGAAGGSGKAVLGSVLSAAWLAAAVELN